MTTAFAPNSQALALEMYALLRALDPNHIKGDIKATLHDQLAQLREQLSALMASVDAASAGPAIETVSARMKELAQIMERHRPSSDIPARWEDFRQNMLPAYERLAASLRHLDIHVPSLRPTNYARNIYHVSNAAFCLVCVRFLDETTVLTLAGFMATVAWSCEIGRRIIPGLNDFLMGLMGRLAHPHEAWRVNSATWFVTACVILALMWNLPVASVGIAVLGFADPAAAIIGRRYGRIKLVNGRTLEGTATFVAVGTVMATLWLALAWSIAPPMALKLGFAGALAGGLAELFSRRVDDNLSIPVAASFMALALMA
jgi:dolichol kinase